MDDMYQIARLFTRAKGHCAYLGFLCRQNPRSEHTATRSRERDALPYPQFQNQVIHFVRFRESEKRIPRTKRSEAHGNLEAPTRKPLAHRANASKTKNPPPPMRRGRASEGAKRCATPPRRRRTPQPKRKRRRRNPRRNARGIQPHLRTNGSHDHART